jgi:hypothetical protein
MAFLSWVFNRFALSLALSSAFDALHWRGSKCGPADCRLARQVPPPWRWLMTLNAPVLRAPFEPDDYQRAGNSPWRCFSGLM